jgi:alpha-1,2-mannosyltransferase
LAGYGVSAFVCCLLTARSRAAFGDLSIYAAGGSAVLHGAHLYQLRFAFGLRFTYPPFAAIVFAPLALLPAVTGEVLVTLATVVAVPVASYLVLRLPSSRALLGRSRAVEVALVFSAAAIWLEPERTNLKYGQINVFIAVLVLADLALLARPSRLSWLRGAGIGLGAGLKLTPAIFVVYLLATRRYRAAATAAAVFAGTVALAFVLVPGDAARYWGTSFFDPGHVGRIQNVANQSLLGALARVLHTLSVGPVWLPVAAVTGVAGLALAVRVGRAGDEALGFALCAVTSLLVSPISWSHHWVLAVPALLLGVVAVVRRFAGAGGFGFGTLAGLVAVLGIAVIGWAGLIWRVPLGGGRYDELGLTPWQLVAADSYVLVGVGVLAVAFAASVSQASTSAFQRRLSASGAKQASNELRASTAIEPSSNPNSRRTAARLSSTYPPK